MAMVEGSYPYLSEKYGISRHTIYSRVARGMSKEEACAKPARRVVLSNAAKIELELEGINPLTVKNRVYNEGMTIEQATAKPIRSYNRYDIDKVKTLAREGFTLWQMAWMLKKAESNVCAYCKKHGIKYKKGVE